MYWHWWSSGRALDCKSKGWGFKTCCWQRRFFYKILSILLLFYDFQPFEEENWLKRVCKHCFVDSFQNVLKAVKKVCKLCYNCSNYLKLAVDVVALASEDWLVAFKGCKVTYLLQKPLAGFIVVDTNYLVQLATTVVCQK